MINILHDLCVNFRSESEAVRKMGEFGRHCLGFSYMRKRLKGYGTTIQAAGYGMIKGIMP